MKTFTQLQESFYDTSEYDNVVESGDLSVYGLYNKWANHYGGNGDSPRPKQANAIEKAIIKIHGRNVMAHLKKAFRANSKQEFGDEEHHVNNASRASKNDGAHVTLGRNRSKNRNESVQIDEARYAYHQIKVNSTGQYTHNVVGTTKDGKEVKIGSGMGRVSALVHAQGLARKHGLKEKSGSNGWHFYKDSSE